MLIHIAILLRRRDTKSVKVAINANTKSWIETMNPALFPARDASATALSHPK
jgi:hypothetical protein